MTLGTPADAAVESRHDRPHRRWRDVGAVLALAALVVQFLGVGLYQAWSDSLTVDEPLYLVSGVSAVTERDLAVNFEHPPLPKVLAVLPVLAFSDFGVDPTSQAFQDADTPTLAMESLDEHRDDVRRITLLARLVPLLEGAAVGVLLALLGRRLFGPLGGLVPAGLWLTLPVVVGFSHLNGLDVPAALSVVATLLLLDRVLERATVGRLAALAVVVGAALLTRAAVGLVVAVAAAAVVAVAAPVPRRWRPLLGVAVLLVGWGLVWGVYTAIDPDGMDPNRLAGVVNDATGAARAATTTPESPLARLPLAVPWPDAYEAGLRFLASYHTEPVPGYLLGRSFDGVPWWFWPATTVLKVTPVALLFVVGGLVGLRGVERGARRRVLLLTLPVLLGLGLMLALAQRPYGARYLLPALAVALLLTGPLARLASSRAGAGVLVAALVAQLGVLWTSLPSSLSWTTPGLGPGWQVAADANVDWGQDFYRLQDWAEDPDHEGAYVSYFGLGPSFELSEVDGAVSAHPQGFFLGTEPVPPGTEWVVVSASHLNAYLSEDLGALDDYCPVDVIGSTMLVYRFEEAPPRLSADSPGPPASLCDDDAGTSREVASPAAR